jgi:hypothetical protein
MSTMVGIIVSIFVLGFVINAFSSPETKLFRRIWSTERVVEFRYSAERTAAVDALFARYGFDVGGAPDSIDEAVGNCLSAAAEFDLKHKNNMGVQVTRVIAGEMLRKVPKGTMPEIEKKLTDAQSLDVVGFDRVIRKTLSEL